MGFDWPSVNWVLEKFLGFFLWHDLSWTWVDLEEFWVKNQKPMH